MKLRDVAYIACLLALLAAPATALAAPKDGHGDTTHEDNGQHNGSDNGNANGADNGNGGGNGIGIGRDAPGPGAATPPGKAPGLPATNSDAEQARTQVESDHALSLDQVLKAVGTVSAGRMLEIKPARFAGRLVYDVTVLERNGVVRHVIVDARTGHEVRTAR